MFTPFKRLTWKASLLSMLISMLAFTVTLAAPGDLDTTFDGDGLVTSYVVPSNPGRDDVVWDISIQPNGKIVATGHSHIRFTEKTEFALARYNRNGSLDTTFHGDGRLTTDLGYSAAGRDVAVQSNGKIVVAGWSCISFCDVALARYNAGGALDTTFSGDGKVTTDFIGDDNGSYGGLAIQSDGKIVVAGYLSNPGSIDFAVYRYLPDGSLDTAFSGDGIAYIRFVGGSYATDLVIQSDGKIVVVGYLYSAAHRENFALARLNVDGSLDTTFSGDGKQTTDFGGAEEAKSVALQPDGKIVVAGSRIIPGTGALYSFALARYNTDGSLDTTFNATGRRVFSFKSGFHSGASDVIVQANGKIVVAGGTDESSNIYNFALVRLNSDGSFDTTFSGNGKVTIDFGGRDWGNALAVQSNGKYVLAGYTDDGTQSDFALARVLP